MLTLEKINQFIILLLKHFCRFVSRTVVCNRFVSSNLIRIHTTTPHHFIIYYNNIICTRTLNTSQFYTEITFKYMSRYYLPVMALLKREVYRRIVRTNPSNRVTYYYNIIIFNTHNIELQYYNICVSAML